MTLTVSQLAANEASLALPIAGDTLNLVYYPNKLTTTASVQLYNGLEDMNKTLSEIIKSWDLLQDDGSMYPLDPDSLAGLGVKLLWEVAKGIVTDIRPN